MTARLLGVWPDRSPEWLAARDGRVGGSDVGVICGWSPHKTRGQLLQERLGLTDRRPTTAGMARGSYCESAVLTWLSDHCKVDYDPERSRGSWVDTEHDWRLYNPDAVTTDGRLVEVKTTAVRDLEHGWGRAMTDQVPLTYAAQVQYGMGILGLKRTLLGVLSGAPRFEFALYKLTFDPQVFTFLAAQAEAFLAELAQAESSAA